MIQTLATDAENIAPFESRMITGFKTVSGVGINEHSTSYATRKRMGNGDLALSRGAYLPKEKQFQCKMPTVSPLPPGAFTNKVADTLPAARGLFRRTMAKSPYSTIVKPRSPNSRWCDREDEPGWPGHYFQHRVNALGQVTPSSSMCTPVHERTRPIHYHPITKAPPQLEYTSKHPKVDAKTQTYCRPRSAPPNRDSSAQQRAQAYELSPHEVRVYERFVELMANMEKAEMLDVAEDVIKDAEEKQMLSNFGGAASPTPDVH